MVDLNAHASSLPLTKKSPEGHCMCFSLSAYRDLYSGRERGRRVGREKLDSTGAVERLSDILYLVAVEAAKDVRQPRLESAAEGHGGERSERRRGGGRGESKGGRERERGKRKERDDETRGKGFSREAEGKQECACVCVCVRVCV